MSRPRVYDTEGIPLRSLPIGEADRLLTILTLARGKLQARARGVRKTTSKLSGHLDMLTRSRLTLSRGQSLDTITGAETIDSFARLKSSLSTLPYAIYAAEVADAFNPLDAPNDRFYGALVAVLRSLDSGRDANLAVRFLELRSLEYSGFALELATCVECGDAIRPNRHYFSPAAGGTLCPSCRPAFGDAVSLTVDALKVLRYLSMNRLDDALKINVKPALQRELAALTRRALHHTLEKELRSSAFLRSMGQSTAGRGCATASTST